MGTSVVAAGRWRLGGGRRLRPRSSFVIGFHDLVAGLPSAMTRAAFRFPLRALHVPGHLLTSWIYSLALLWLLVGLFEWFFEGLFMDWVLLGR